MYARKISVRYQVEGSQIACPLKWLDNFAMRNFTNDPVFDDTLPIADGTMEIGTRVPLDRLRLAGPVQRLRSNFFNSVKHLPLTV